MSFSTHLETSHYHNLLLLLTSSSSSSSSSSVKSEHANLEENCSVIQCITDAFRIHLQGVKRQGRPFSEDSNSNPAGHLSASPSFCGFHTRNYIAPMINW